MPRLSTFYSTSIWPYVRVRPLVYAWLVATATATTVSDTLSLHDALPISARLAIHRDDAPYLRAVRPRERVTLWGLAERRSEEHTSELQSRENLVCRLLLEKKHHPPAAEALSAPGPRRLAGDRRPAVRG